MQFTFINLFIVCSEIIIACYLVNRFVLPAAVASDLVKEHKFKTLDAIRGLAALFVIIHHSAFIYTYHSTGRWIVFPVGINDYLLNVYVNFGHAAVSIFFMVTGFLFFDKISSGNGVGDVFDFYSKRIKRILPMYAASSVAAIALLTAIGITATPLGMLRGVFGWFSFGFLPVETISEKVVYARAVAGVYWTLAIEWKFYFILPFLSLFCRGVKNSLVFVLISSSVILLFWYASEIDDKSASILLCFEAGAFSSVMNKVIGEALFKKLESKFLALVALLALVFEFVYFNTAYHPGAVLFLFVFFFIAANGNDLLGLLNLRFLKMAGLVSYSVYLIHGLVINSVNITSNGHLSYIQNTLLAIPLIILVSIFTYAYIERPFIVRKVSVSHGELR